jgi:hypothetical protein
MIWTSKGEGGLFSGIVGVILSVSAILAGDVQGAVAGSNLDMLDAPVLFTKRHSYQGIHIYDTYYQWWPGGGIYVLDNPRAAKEEQVVRAVIDAGTAETLGEGVYSDPELSWDATKVLFSFKGEKDGNTCLYEIGIDGRGLRRLTDGSRYETPCGRHLSQHDIGGAYLPDGRIVFTSTRLNGLVPCNNTGVDILHVMNADGSDVHAISVNNVNEFDPAILPDGRILYGRWEYVDKTALTQQTLWTIFPDGSNETAFYANNLVRPEAFLDARPVPGYSHLVVASLARHNSTPRGSVGFVDVYVDKNDPAAITNLDHPEDATIDTGNSCEPWPLSDSVVLMSARPSGYDRNVMVLADREGRREVVYSDPAICVHSPMPVKARVKPPVLDEQIDRNGRTGLFFVQDIYMGLEGVRRGEVKQLRVIEETSRVTGTHGAEYNQQFLLSAALAFSVKNYLGVVPVEEDGSAYFEVPSGRAVYLQALDKDGRLIRSMRTFVGAPGGSVRSCIGCHEHKYSAARNIGNKAVLGRAPSELAAESWGSGFVDYPSMVQPVFNRHCVSCHGGEKGFAGGLDLSGGWTEHFSISYQNLVNRRNNQLTATLISGIDCMNGTARWSAQIFGVRSHGSGNAPLADVLVSGHEGRIKNLSRKERDLVLAWIDSNGLYHGTWDYAEGGVKLDAYNSVKSALTKEMRTAGCMSCHENEGKSVFEDDWFNLKEPRMSRILRGPLANGGEGWGVEACRDHKVEAGKQRIRMYFTGGYVHSVMDMEAFNPVEFKGTDTSGKSHVSFASTEDEHYVAMLDIIKRGRREALAKPRTDMPGAKVVGGLCKSTIPPEIPDMLPELRAECDDEGIVELSWERSAELIGLDFALYRGERDGFEIRDAPEVGRTTRFRYADTEVGSGRHYYALVGSAGGGRSRPVYGEVVVPEPKRPDRPEGVSAVGMPGEIRIGWKVDDDSMDVFNVYRAAEGSDDFVKLNAGPVVEGEYIDAGAAVGQRYQYAVGAVSRRNMESDQSQCVVCEVLPERKEPVFVAIFKEDMNADTIGGNVVKGKVHGAAVMKEGYLNLGGGGHVTYPYSRDLDIGAKLTLEMEVRLESVADMPVLVSFGRWNDKGWFVQKLGDRWRWHLGGVDCDGGDVAAGRWIHLAGTYDGKRSRLYQDGREVGSVECEPNKAAWNGELLVGQYAGGTGPAYQVKGMIRDVKIYRRAVSAAEILAHSRDER